MFNIKEDRRVVEITIAFNITAIIDWLESGGKFEDIDKIKREEHGSWGNSITQKYGIDMLPIGKTSNAYFHRNRNIVSQNMCGIDYLGSIDADIKSLLKRWDIQALEWSIWKGALLLMIHNEEGREIIFATPPLTEAVELERKGRLNNPGSLRDEDKKMRVIVSLNQDGTPKESIDIWRGSASNKSVGYGNALGHVSFSILNFEVEY